MVQTFRRPTLSRRNSPKLVVVEDQSFPKLGLFILNFTKQIVSKHSLSLLSTSSLLLVVVKVNVVDVVAATKPVNELSLQQELSRLVSWFRF